MLDFHFWIWSSFGLLPGEKVLTQGKKEEFQKIKKTCSKLVSFRFFCLSNFGLEMPFLCFELQDLSRNSADFGNIVSVAIFFIS